MKIEEPCDHIVCAQLVDYDTGSLWRKSEVDKENWYKPSECEYTTVFNFCPDCGEKI